MKKLLALLTLALAVSIANAQATYNQFAPGGALSGTWNSQSVNLAAGPSFITGLLPIGNGGLGVGPITGIVKGTGVGYGAAGVSDILGLFTGTCSSTTLLHGSGVCGQVNLTTDVTATLTMANGGLGATSFTANDVLLGNGSSPFNVLALGVDTLLQGTAGAPDALSVPNCVGSTSALNYSTTTHTITCQTIAVGSGTITGVTITVPSWLTVSGSPCTSGNCSFTVSAATGQTANQGLFSPDGASGALSVRALVPADIPQINLSCSTGNGCITGILGVPNGGNGLSSATLGDTRYGSGTNTIAILPGNTTTTKQFYTQTGTGTVSAPPVWGTIANSDLPTSGATAGSYTCSNETVNAQGIVTAISNGTCGTGTPGGVSSDIQYNNAGAFAGASDFTYSTGGVVAGSPTGGAKGAGTINMVQAYVQGKALYVTGSYTGTIGGCSTAPTITVSYTIVGDVVTLEGGFVNCTSNATTLTLSGGPVAVQPAVIQEGPFSSIENNTVQGVMGGWIMTLAGTIDFELMNPSTGALGTTTFTSSGTKGLTPSGDWVIHYKLD